jgi:tRNA (adenine37-N6)-methyltransferase
MAFEIEPVAFVRGGRTDPLDDEWGGSVVSLDLAEGVPEESLASLDQFSHAEVIFVFDRVTEEEIVRGARHPRGRKDWPLVGIFAQRGKNRPNRLGVCVCEVLKIEGRSVMVRGLDAIDGTPVVDVKPVMTGFLPRGEVREPNWAKVIMKNYW